MIRSMYSAVSGLRGHQTMMDVVGNNIANVNTTGFKSSMTVVQDTLSQVLRGPGAPTAVLGGTSPAQVGLGMRTAAITTNYSQGAMQRTNRPTDIAIQGDGFFVVDQAGDRVYTRAGNFSLDALGRVVTQDGGFVLGWSANAAGVVDPNSPIGQLRIPVGGLLAPRGTQEIRLGGNLPVSAPQNTGPGTPPGSQIINSVDVYDDAGQAHRVAMTFTKTSGAGVVPSTWTVTAQRTPPGSQIVNSVDVYDDSGQAHRLTLTFTKTTAAGAVPSTWTVTGSRIPPGGGAAVAVALTDNTLTFNGTGALTAPADRDINIAAGQIPNTANPIAIELGQLTDADRLSGYGDPNTIAILSQDGYAAGSLTSFAVGQDGTISGSYSNGRTQSIGQLALALFATPEGLEKAGGNNLRPTVNSGLAQIGGPQIGGRGSLSMGNTEMSNVDLAQEFTNLIAAQRGFQANSRVVTTSDEILQEVVNLKRLVAELTQLWGWGAARPPSLASGLMTPGVTTDGATGCRCPTARTLGREQMILLTRLNGLPFAINADLIERVEITPDTVLSLVDGKKYVVGETAQEVIDRVVAFRASILVVADQLQRDPDLPSSRRLRLVTDSREV